MIAELDSSIDRPSPAQAAAAYSGGVRVWGGYIGIRPTAQLGLQAVWSQAEFDVVLNAGMTAIGYCSGWDDPVAIRDLAKAWGVLPCVDVEPGIRDDGPWLDTWLAASGAGLYGLQRVHYETGQPIGRGAAFNIMANYPGFDPRATWNPLLPAPAAPHGWQWQGTHTEYGLSVDSNWLDDALGVRTMTDDDIRVFCDQLYYTVAGRYPNDADRAEIEARWLPAYRANPRQMRYDFGVAAQNEQPGKNIALVRHYELPAVPPGPVVIHRHRLGANATLGGFTELSDPPTV